MKKNATPAESSQSDSPLPKQNNSPLPQESDMSITNLQTAKEPTPKRPSPLPSNQTSWFLILLVLVTVAPSLIALVFPSCNDGSLHLKVWALEYQLTKKGSCASLPKTAQN